MYFSFITQFVSLVCSRVQHENGQRYLTKGRFVTPLFMTAGVSSGTKSFFSNTYR